MHGDKVFKDSRDPSRALEVASSSVRLGSVAIAVTTPAGGPGWIWLPHTEARKLAHALLVQADKEEKGLDDEA